MSHNKAHSFINDEEREQNFSHLGSSSKSLIKEENSKKQPSAAINGIKESNINTLNLKKIYEFYDDPHVLSNSNSFIENNNYSNNKQNKSKIIANYQGKLNEKHQIQGHSQSVQLMMPESHHFDYSGDNPNFDETSHFSIHQTPLSEIDRQGKLNKKDFINTTRTNISNGNINPIIVNSLSSSNSSNNGSTMTNTNQLPSNTSFGKSKSNSRIQDTSLNPQNIYNNQSMIQSTHKRQKDSSILHSQSYIQANANDNSHLNTSSQDPKRFRKLTLHNYKNYEQQVKGQLDSLISGMEGSVKCSDIYLSTDRLSSPNFSNLSQIKIDIASSNANKNSKSISILKTDEFLQPSSKSHRLSMGSSNNVQIPQQKSSLTNSKLFLNKGDEYSYSNSPFQKNRIKSTRQGNESNLLNKTNSTSPLSQNNNLQQPILKNERYDNINQTRLNSDRTNSVNNSSIHDVHSGILGKSNTMNNNYMPIALSQNLGSDYIQYQERNNQGSNRNSTSSIFNIKTKNTSPYQLTLDEKDILSIDKGTPVKRAHHSSISENKGLATFSSFNLNLDLKNVIQDSFNQNNNNINQNPLIFDKYRKIEGSQTNRNPITNSEQKKQIIDVEKQYKMNFSHNIFNKNIAEIATLHKEVFSQILENAEPPQKPQNSTRKDLFSSPTKHIHNLNFENSGSKEIKIDSKSRGSLEHEFSRLIRLESNRKNGGLTKLINEYDEAKYDLPLKIESYRKSVIESGYENTKNVDKLSEKKFEFQVSYMYDLIGHKNSILALAKDNTQNLLWSSSLDHNIMVYISSELFTNYYVDMADK